MDKKRWQRIQELFEQAQSMEPAVRDAFLAEQTSDDLSIADEVRSMLADVPPSEFLNAPTNLPPEDSYSGGGLEGLKMGEFELIEEIGHGGMGVVYRAHQAGLERDVAVKILPKIRTGDEVALERFRREAKAASNLNHPNVVPILSVGESHGMAWYAMALIEGQDLGSFIQKLKSGDPRAKAVFGEFGTVDYFRNLAAAFAQVCDAVHYAHQSGVIHRDIKPANILLDPNGKLLLTDFGLAKDERFGSMSVTGQLQGTPHYMSPEQARASVNKIDHRTDIYSLAVVLYEMLSLRRPFGGDSALEVLAQITTKSPRPLRGSNKGVPLQLAILAEKGMAKKALERFPDVGDFAADLRRFSRGEAIHTLGPTPWSRLKGHLKRRKTAYLQTAFPAFIALVSLFAYQKWQDFMGMVPVKIETAKRGWVAHVYEIQFMPSRLELVRKETSSFRLQPGRYRIVLEHEGVFCEFTRYLTEPCEEVVLAPRFLAEAEVTSEMVEIQNLEIANLGLQKVGNYRLGAYAAKPFEIKHIWVDPHEVTNGDYWNYLRSIGSSDYPIHWGDAKALIPLDQVIAWEAIPKSANRWASMPVIGITQVEAKAYAEWAGKRLPTYEEWTAIARGVADRDYPWGDNPGGQYTEAVAHKKIPTSDWPWEGYWDYVEPAGKANNIDVTSHYAIENVYGNVAEWTESPFLLVEEEGGVPIPQSEQVLFMGESWRSGQDPAPLGSFVPNSPYIRWVGFRCVKGTYEME